MALTLELHADGGIRLGTPDEDGPRHIASLEQARKWVADAVRRGLPVHVSGDVSAPLAQPVLQAVRDAGAEPVVRDSTPAPWPDGLSTLQVAARDGHVDYVTDLLDRGASPDAARPELSPYRLAMLRGHIPVLQALRSAGVPDPVKGKRPPGCSPGTVVLRSYLSRGRRQLLTALLAAPIVLGAAGAVALGDPAALVVGVVVTAAVGLQLALILVLVAGLRIAIDGTELHMRNAWRWKGPVDLRRLAALGYTPPARRVPAYFRLIQTAAGTKLLPGSLVGFDKDVAKAIREQGGLKTMLIGFKGGYLSPGLPRFLGRCVTGTDAVLSAPARAIIDRYSDGAPVRAGAEQNPVG
jgi:hypothetical protein